MVYTIYIDVIFFTNAFMDMAVLLVVGRVFSCRPGLVRLSVAAAAGGFWACALVLCPDMPVWLQEAGTYLGVSTLMAVVAFKFRSFKETAKMVAGIYLASVVLGGVFLTLKEQAGTAFSGTIFPFTGSVWFLLAAGAVLGCFGLTGLLKSHVKQVAMRKDNCQVTLICGERKETVKGLIDTGNRLVEPATGRPVHVAEKELMKRLCPLVEGVIYVPYRTVGGKGLLPALFVDEMEVEFGGECYRLERPLVAVSDAPLSSSGDYQILIQKTDEGLCFTHRRTFS